MDDEEARQKEAERTLNRIKGTLHHLEDGSAWEEPITDNEEFQRMKQLIESGYSHTQPGRLDKFRKRISKPIIPVLLIIAILVIVELMQRYA